VPYKTISTRTQACEENDLNKFYESQQASFLKTKKNTKVYTKKGRPKRLKTKRMTLYRIMKNKIYTGPEKKFAKTK
jgi:hypothetical protein